MKVLVSDGFAVKISASSRNGTFPSCAALGQIFSCPGSHIDEDADVLAPRSDIGEVRVFFFGDLVVLPGLPVDPSLVAVCIYIYVRIHSLTQPMAHLSLNFWG